MSLNHSLYEEALPMLTLWQKVSGKAVNLVIEEDNEATIKIIKKGYSSKLRSLGRTHRVNLGAIHETLQQPDVRLPASCRHVHEVDRPTKVAASY